VDHAQAWDTSPHSQSSAELLDKHLDCAYWYGTIRTPFRDLNDLEGKLLMTEFHKLIQNKLCQHLQSS